MELVDGKMLGVKEKITYPLLGTLESVVLGEMMSLFF